MPRKELLKDLNMIGWKKKLREDKLYSNIQWSSTDGEGKFVLSKDQ